MPHQFNDSLELTGTWSKDNGRRYCSWKYDQTSGVMRVSRGRTVWSRSLDIAEKEIDTLRAMLPRLALDILNEQADSSDAA
ncbi:MAG: hypothetical protein O3A63_11505 [Proteobacteria bacterium]|nr:hypothetical protein [Pseudomonadota bacterium]